MAKNGFLAAVLVCLIVGDAFGSGASLALRLRKEVGSENSVNSSPPPQVCSLYFSGRANCRFVLYSFSISCWFVVAKGVDSVICFV